MAEFGPEIAADVVAAAQAGVAEAVEALNRSLDGDFQLQVGEPGAINPDQTPDDWAGPGLVIVLKVPGGAALLVLSEATGLLPPWYQAPDATGVSKLATLAQELGMVLLPDEFMPEDFQAQAVGNVGEAITRGGVAQGAALVPLSLTSGEQSGTLFLVWPAAAADAVFREEAESSPPAETDSADSPPQQSPPQPSPVPEETAAASPNDASPPAPKKRIRYADIEEGLRHLPGYARSILKVQVPVVVTLASTTQPVSRIIELGPGSIIQFDKSCEETLSLEVGGQEVAVGEAVKVGDKFGLRITSMIMPEERFWTVRGKRGVEKSVGRKGDGVRAKKARD
ncbi:MAG: FliM/FliN family flagellar motor switch protein [Pirellulaceae bacterium]